MKSPLQSIADAVRQAQTILISTHERPDGDAMGSELALMEMAAHLGKTAEVVNHSAVPGIYAFMPGAGAIRKRPRHTRNPDLAISVDAPNLARLGDAAKYFNGARVTVSIDHHPDNENATDHVWADAARSSTGEMILELAEHMGKITPTMATNLYTALLADTGRFCFSNTSAASFDAARRLVSCGADPNAIAVQLYQSTPEAVLRLAGTVQSRVKFHFGGRVAVMSLSCDQFARSGVSTLDTQDFSDMPRDVLGVEVGIFLREESPDFVKVSLRAKNDFDVSEIARQFGGGGHRAAAGCTVHKPLRAAKTAVLAALAPHFDHECPPAKRR